MRYANRTILAVMVLALIAGFVAPACAQTITPFSKATIQTDAGPVVGYFVLASDGRLLLMLPGAGTVRPLVLADLADPGPAPPVPPVPPVPETLDVKVKLWCAGLPAEAKALAPKMAAAYEAIAAEIEAKNLATGEEIAKRTAVKCGEAVDGQRDAWLPVVGKLQEYLDVESAAGRLVTPAEYLAAWKLIAAGLGGVK